MLLRDIYQKNLEITKNSTINRLTILAIVGIMNIIKDRTMSKNDD